MMLKCFTPILYLMPGKRTVDPSKCGNLGGGYLGEEEEGDEKEQKECRKAREKETQPAFPSLAARERAGCSSWKSL